MLLAFARSWEGRWLSFFLDCWLVDLSGNVVARVPDEIRCSFVDQRIDVHVVQVQFGDVVLVSLYVPHMSDEAVFFVVQSVLRAMCDSIVEWRSPRMMLAPDIVPGLVSKVQFPASTHGVSGEKTCQNVTASFVGLPR